MHSSARQEHVEWKLQPNNFPLQVSSLTRVLRRLMMKKDSCVMRVYRASCSQPVGAACKGDNEVNPVTAIVFQVTPKHKKVPAFHIPVYGL